MIGLLNNSTIKETAKNIGVSERTIYRALEDEDFRKQFDAKRQELLEENCRLIQYSMQNAIETIVTILNDSSNSSQVRLNACDSLLKHSYKITEQCEILKRLEALERNCG